MASATTERDHTSEFKVLTPMVSLRDSEFHSIWLSGVSPYTGQLRDFFQRYENFDEVFWATPLAWDILRDQELSMDKLERAFAGESEGRARINVASAFLRHKEALESIFDAVARDPRRNVDPFRGQIKQARPRELFNHIAQQNHSMLSGMVGSSNSGDDRDNLNVLTRMVEKTEGWLATLTEAYAAPQGVPRPTRTFDCPVIPVGLDERVLHMNPVQTVMARNWGRVWGALHEAANQPATAAVGVRRDQIERFFATRARVEEAAKAGAAEEVTVTFSVQEQLTKPDLDGVRRDPELRGQYLDTLLEGTFVLHQLGFAHHCLHDAVRWAAQGGADTDDQKEERSRKQRAASRATSTRGRFVLSNFVAARYYPKLDAYKGMKRTEPMRRPAWWPLDEEEKEKEEERKKKAPRAPYSVTATMTKLRDALNNGQSTRSQPRPRRAPRSATPPPPSPAERVGLLPLGTLDLHAVACQSYPRKLIELTRPVIALRPVYVPIIRDGADEKEPEKSGLVVDKRGNVQAVPVLASEPGVLPPLVVPAPKRGEPSTFFEGVVAPEMTPRHNYEGSTKHVRYANTDDEEIEYPEAGQCTDVWRLAWRCCEVYGFDRPRYDMRVWANVYPYLVDQARKHVHEDDVVELVMALHLMANNDHKKRPSAHDLLYNVDFDILRTVRLKTDDGATGAAGKSTRSNAGYHGRRRVYHGEEEEEEDEYAFDECECEWELPLPDGMKAKNPLYVEHKELVRQNKRLKRSLKRVRRRVKQLCRVALA